MFKKAFVVALMTATAITPAFADDDDDVETLSYEQEVTLSNISGVDLEITCDFEFCQVQSLQPGSDVWDREEVQPVDDNMFDSLVNKYTALGYS